MKNRLASILVLTGCLVFGAAQTFAACGEKSKSGGCDNYMARSTSCDMPDCDTRPTPDECESSMIG